MQSASRFLRIAGLVAVLLCTANLFGQALAGVQGQVTDQTGAVVSAATVTVTNAETSVSQTTKTDPSGNYQVPGLPVGTYSVEVQASGLEKQIAKDLVLQVNRNTVQNFQLKVAQANEVVTVEGEVPLIESSTMTVGQVLDPKNVQEIPLNGRHFIDLGFLIPGSVTPPSNGFLSQPIRGQGSLAFNTAGQREDTVNFMVNGINLADMGNGQITFQPSIATLDEFKVDNSTYSADSGRNSGAIVNMATRSGKNSFHGEAFDFLRNNYFDARNFFNKVGAQQSQFIRNDFGGDVGGPIIKNKLFFYGSYEGLRQRQGISINQPVLTSAQRASALASPSPTVQKLVPLIPAANDSTGGKFIGSASAPVVLDQWTGDISWNINEKDRLHGYYAIQRDVRTEPTDAGGGSTVPGYGDQRTARRQIFTLNESHVFNSSVVNQAYLGFNRIHILFDPINKLDPTTFGINGPRSGPVGLPEINIGTLGSGGLDFGGVSGFPQGRGDLTSVLADSVSYLRGNHSFKFGWEGRQVNDNGTFSHDLGFVQFNNPTDFINGNIALYTNGLDVSPHVIQRALAFYAMDNYRVKSYLTLELGLRYEWNMTPFERDNRQSEFLTNGQLVQIGTSQLPLIYQQNNKNFEPRVGFAWDLFHNGKTVLRSGYGYAVNQPLPLQLNGNPPFTNQLRFSSSGAKQFTSFATLATDAASSGANIATVDQNYKNAYVQSYNLNVQQQITLSTSMMIGYFGSKGTHLQQNINLNQPFYTDAVGTQSKPFTNIAANSPINPGATLGSSLTERVSNGNANYNALWVTGTKNLTKGLQFSANYVWSKSLDYASQNGSGQPENSLNVRGDYGLSDFDTRNRFVFNGLYELPFKRNRLVEGWRVSGVLTLQSGNPLNILAGAPIAGATGSGIPAGSSSLFTGVSRNRPDLIAPPVIVNQIITSGANAGLIQWLAPNSVCDPRFGPCAAGTSYELPVTIVNGPKGPVNIYHFGDLTRNSVIGPDFKNLDLSLAKSTKITERLNLELRAEAFDAINHPNFGNPSLTAVTSAGNSFGIINSTRFPNGDSGSARQLQFAAKVTF